MVRDPYALPNKTLHTLLHCCTAMLGTIVFVLYMLSALVVDVGTTKYLHYLPYFLYFSI